MNAELSSALALLGLLLAVVGIFSVLSYTVTQRTREIGIRLAVGARRADVQRWALLAAARPVALGLSIGMLAALALSRLLEHLLTGVGKHDPVTFVAVAARAGSGGAARCLAPRAPCHACRSDHGAA